MLILGSKMLFLPGMIMMMCVFVLLCGRRRISLTESAGSTWQTWQTLLWPWRSHSWISTTSHSTTSCSALVCADTWPIFVCVTCCAMVLEWKQKLFSYGNWGMSILAVKTVNRAAVMSPIHFWRARMKLKAELTDCHHHGSDSPPLLNSQLIQNESWSLKHAYLAGSY